jgi:acetoin utilization deacetylase AcuC-like enzyme
MKAFWSDAELAHAPQFFLQRGVVRRNYEVPARAEALLASCRAMGLEVVAPPAASRSALLEVHPAEYLDFLRDGPRDWAAMEGAGPELVANTHPSPEMLANGARIPEAVTGRLGWYTADTACPITPDTWAAAEAAAFCAVAAADEVAEGRHAYALARPPGHHAYAARAGGHCYLNNAAMAAERLRMRGAGRVGILDIDSHHGNGTQGIFWERDDVMFVSVHGDPHGYYPWFVGHARERGAGAGVGCNLNLPLARGSGDEDWTIAIATGLRLIEDTGCDALVVSLGFDASVDEPLGFLAVTAEGFARAGALIGKSGLDCALVQEGGYNTEVMGGLLTRFIEGLEG